MARYYLIHQLAMFDMLASVITMMAAIFAVTWVQKNNEMLAMLAAGVSTQRIIRPVWSRRPGQRLRDHQSGTRHADVRRGAPEVARRRRHVYTIPVSSRYDTNGIILEGKEADRACRSIQSFTASVDRTLLGQIYELRGTRRPTSPRTTARPRSRGMAGSGHG